MQSVKALVSLSLKTSDDNEIKWTSLSSYVVDIFTKYHNHSIQQLLHNFPPNHVNDDGTFFWTASKRLPHVLTIDNYDDDELIKLYLVSVSRLFANILQWNNDDITDEKILNYYNNVKIKEFIPQTIHIKVNEENDDNNNNDSSSGCDNNNVNYEDLLNDLFKELKDICSSNSGSIFIRSEQFEKDDDTNHHINFVHSSGNLRARNYDIEECSRHESKMIAGKIIPALATTTGMVTGFVVMEMLKALSPTDRTVEDFSNTFNDLAQPTIMLTEPVPPKRRTDGYDKVMGSEILVKPEGGFTTWDKVEVREGNDITLAKLINIIKEKFQANSSVLSVGSKMLYLEFSPKHQTRLPKKLKDLVTDDLQIPLHNDVLVIEAACTDIETDKDVVIPKIAVYLN